MPRSPWLASLGCTKKAGVPVDAKVDAILRATWPDLPMPVTMTRPCAARINSTAAANEVAEPVAQVRQRGHRHRRLRPPACGVPMRSRTVPGRWSIGLTSVWPWHFDSTERALRQACSAQFVNADGDLPHRPLILQGFSLLQGPGAPSRGRSRRGHHLYAGGAPRRCRMMRARARASASPSGSRIAAIGLSGFQCQGLVGPKIAIVGVPIAADTCMSPELLVTEISAAASARIALRKSELVKSRTRLPPARQFASRCVFHLVRPTPRPMRPLSRAHVPVRYSTKAATLCRCQRRQATTLQLVCRRPRSPALGEP